MAPSNVMDISHFNGAGHGFQGKGRGFHLPMINCQSETINPPTHGMISGRQSSPPKRTFVRHHRR